ncbi:MAG: hypothetical protein AAGD04_05965 [Pseudomonadota bacterium]
MTSVFTWWAWGALALILAICEMLLPGFVLLGFAIGAGIVSMILLMGGPLASFLMGSVPMLLLAFAILSLLAWIGLRSGFKAPGGNVKTFDKDVNDD